MKKFKGYRTMTFNLVVFLTGLLNILSNQNLTDLIIQWGQVFGQNWSPDIVNGILITLVAIINWLLRVNTDTKVWHKE